MDIHSDSPEFAGELGAGRLVAYFGYGSLVNRRTLRTKFLAIRRAEITGWRRCWVPRRDAGPALLSMRPEVGHRTAGVVVFDRADHLPAVDEREAGYLRRVVEAERLAIENAPDGPAPLYLYEAAAETPDAAEAGAYILQSYLDAVLLGFLDLYGEDGVRRFVAETDGFETTVLTDRAAPLYPRSVELDAGSAGFFDQLLTERGVAFRTDGELRSS